MFPEPPTLDNPINVTFALHTLHEVLYRKNTKKTKSRNKEHFYSFIVPPRFLRSRIKTELKGEEWDLRVSHYTTYIKIKHGSKVRLTSRNNKLRSIFPRIIFYPRNKQN